MDSSEKLWRFVNLYLSNGELQSQKSGYVKNGRDVIQWVEANDKALPIVYPNHEEARIVLENGRIKHYLDSILTSDFPAPLNGFNRIFSIGC